MIIDNEIIELYELKERKTRNSNTHLLLEKNHKLHLGRYTEESKNRARLGSVHPRIDATPEIMIIIGETVLDCKK